jgi:hypothetical protein
MTAARHWHGYTWDGTAADLRDESQRRPAGPNEPETQAFLRSSLPPVRTGHYLLRRPDAGRTWVDPDEVINWLVAQYERRPPQERENGAQAYVGLNSWIGTSCDGLVSGVDAWWQYYINNSGGQVVWAAICCPHTHLLDIPCPMPPRT